MPKTDTFTLTGRTMLTADGRAVPAGHPDGIRLLGTEGKTIPLDDAKKFGLVKEPKAVKKPPATKAVKPSEDK